ncbi:branched-chain amino acid ABC transporter permease [Advenella faeciporci]|uniref:Branched-chain amino acid ABC transporter permease n=1 Tax=Advenella faeciporci TaxID=797535 RepID=A0A918JJZ6_9BURK|nr:branched-chain amino acid ABC transporter permease [Advenella faeciporci]NLY35536.1 branched-chain amino acid ABC transporter permease [Alcaligenaceae bacterium]GGW85432.1 branched-chain amino acid ABC transporter permease [Advenella faeciporci]
MINYILNLLTLATIYSIAAASLNVLVGYAGIFSIAHAIFFGLGAYAGAQFALLIVPDVLLASLIGAVVSGALSLLLALPALRVRGEYFVAAGLGLQMVGITIFSEAHSLTGGHGGLVGIPPATLFGFDVSSPGAFLAVCLVALLLSLAVIQILMRSSFGRALMSIRDNESAAESFGKNVPLLKTLAMVVGCAIVGVAGTLFAFNLAFINVESFTLEQSILMLAMVVIGGVGTLSGPLIGAVFLLILPAILTFIPFIPPTEIGTVQQFIYGSLMAVLMIFKPSGIAGKTGGK